MHFLRKAAPYLYITGLIALVAGLPLWLLLISLSQFVLLGAWLFDGNVSRKLKTAFTNPVILVVLGIYLLHVAGLAFTTDFKYAMDDLRVKLPLIILPLVIGTMPPLPKKHFDLVLKVLLASTLCSTLYSAFIRAGLTNRVITNIREISPLISHIRLSLIICLCFAVIAYLLRSESNKKIRGGLYILGIWFVIFLFILQSLTGIIILLMMILALIIYGVLRSKSVILKISCALVTGCFIYASIHVYHTIFVDSIKKIEVHKDMMLDKTRMGNTYTHDLSREDEENGNPVWINICDTELDSSWNARSSLNFSGKDSKGGELRYTLVRFLTSKNLAKDAESVNRLTAEEIKAIENGIANVNYMHGITVQTRLKQLAWEYRSYYYANNPSGHSIMQRLEFWKTGLYIFKKYPLTGTGTGDIKIEYEKAYNETKSSLHPEFRLRAHNEYLTMFITFGIIGGCYFIFALLYPWFKLRKKTDILYTCALAIILLSMFMEDTPESQAGATIFAFFTTFFLFHDYGKRGIS